MTSSDLLDINGNIDWNVASNFDDQSDTEVTDPHKYLNELSKLENDMDDNCISDVASIA